MQNSLAICGAFKGAQQATRYEVAAMVARAVAAGDAKHASKKDVELLKKLCVEFKDELAALGAKTDKLDKRVTKLEKGIGSWKISGRFKFNANFTGGDNDEASVWTKQRGKTNFTKDTARMFFRRQITEDTYFDSQFRLGSDWAGDQGLQKSGQSGLGEGDTSAFSVRKFYVGTKLPFWGLEVKIGRSQFDWEGDFGLYNDEDALIGDWRMDGFWFTKKWSKVKLDAVIGRNQSGGTRNYATDMRKYNHMLYSLSLKWDVNDKFFLGGMAYWMQGDNAYDPQKAAFYDGSNMQTYGITAGYKFNDGIQLKGVYYWQKLSTPKGALDDNQFAWKAILDIKQSVLKFTDLWIEYASYKNGFGGNNGANGGVNCYALTGAAEPGIQWIRPVNNETSKIWFVKAEQKWNKKWSTFVRFNHGNWGTEGLDNAWEWGLGVKYKLNPAITFMLAYDQINYGDNNASMYGTQAGDYEGLHGKDNVLIFHTDVKF